MQREWTFGIGIVALGVIALWGLWRTYREFGSQRSNVSAALVWVIYLMHLGLTIAATILSVWPLPIPRWAGIGLGLPLLIFGIVVCVAGMLNFRSFRRMSGLDTQKLITDGIYAWSRNPQNAGWIASLAGTTLLGRSGLALLLTLVFAAIFAIYLRLEEAHLQKVFGQTYRDYMQQTCRLFGPPGSTPASPPAQEPAPLESNENPLQQNSATVTSVN